MTKLAIFVLLFFAKLKKEFSSMLKDNFTTLVNILFTPRCVLCHGDTNCENICASCRSLCTPYPLHAFSVQAQEFGALYYYEWSVRELIKGAKFYRNSAHAQALKELIHQALDHSFLVRILKDFAPDAITYVPTHPLKRIARGIDLPSLFAGILAKRLNVPVISLLKKNRWAQALSLIHNKNERQSAVIGSLKPVPCDLRLERLVIVDDIYTTGSTFDESMKMLKDICRECRCVALARTP